jgi:glycosyltransferase involved in cell wall biosynthesis
MPRVSVIIPAHNAAAVLAETLESLIAQTYADWEAIVVDDASEDDTAAVATGRDPRILCVRSERNLGPAGARNLALAHAQGELVALLDADDLWLPHYLARQLARYDVARSRGEDVGIVCCDAYELYPSGTAENTYSARAGWTDEVTLTSLLRCNTIFVSALAPRSVIAEVGGFSTECFGSEDYDLWLQILESGHTVVTTHEPLAIYRVADGSVSANVLGMARTLQTTYRRALARGRLNALQRVIARRELRLQRLVELWEEVALSRSETSQLPWRALTSGIALGVRVVLERPARWSKWLRILMAIVQGAPAAGVDRSRQAPRPQR